MTNKNQKQLGSVLWDIANDTIYYKWYKQQKIADCLSSLDELISTQRQKITTLQQHKKGLMQNLFPNNETIL